jgi:hypothetical protein
MGQPIELDQVPSSSAAFARYDSAAAESWADTDSEDAALYQEIAERRAHLECAETLRRVRAL